VRWQYGLDYTLTDGVRKQGKTGRPHASKRPEPDFLEKNSRNSGEACPICELQSSLPDDGRTYGNRKKKGPFSAAELKE
jgi:hypothetical protein